MLFQLVSSARDSSVHAKAAGADQVYVTLTERGLLSVFDSEEASTSGRPPVYRGQVPDFARSGEQIQPSLSPQHHLMKLFGRDSTASTPPALSFIVQDCLSGPSMARIGHLFPASESEREAWQTALAGCIDIRKGEALLADEKVILELERGGQLDRWQ